MYKVFVMLRTLNVSWLNMTRYCIAEKFSVYIIICFTC